MSQPCDRGAEVPLPGTLDNSLKEFWNENPWEIVRDGHNLSAFERNRTWMNLRGGAFLDVSFLSATDSDGDGRAVVAGDFRNTGQLDLIVRQVSGGPIHVYENAFPPGRYLTVSLRGVRSNRQGIGARLVAEFHDPAEGTSGLRRVVRELYPADGFRGQGASRVHFGLGEADRVERLTIRWPSGEEQVLTDLATNRHIVVTEGANGSEAVEIVSGE